jgi:hypothetical protein
MSVSISNQRSERKTFNTGDSKCKLDRLALELQEEYPAIVNVEVMLKILQVRVFFVPLKSAFFACITPNTFLN